jgi:inner membrane protein
MASPLLHAATGAALARRVWDASAARVLGLAAAACLPDLDLLPGLLRGDPFRYHHGLSHSLGAGLIVAMALALVLVGGVRDRARAAFAIGGVYASHLALDLMSYDAFPADGVGIPLFWPLSEARVLAPVHLFFFGIAPDATGLTDGILRVGNAWAVAWEAGLVLLAAVLLSLRARRPDRGSGRRRRPALALTGGLAAALLLLVSCPHLTGNVLEDLEAAPPGGSPTAGPESTRSESAAGGWDDLPAPAVADSSLATVPLADAARDWIREQRALIREVADGLGVSPVSLAGVVAAERTLLHDPFDASVDALFRAYFATLSEEELRTWIGFQEAAYQRELHSAGDPGLRVLKNPYLWSVGPSQVSFRNALFYEPRLAKLQRRPERSVREIVSALVGPRGSLEYAAVILLDAQEAYARYADLDVRAQPGILATLYHLGSPARRAIRLGEENRRRELEGEPPIPPRMNFYGAFVDRHAAELEALLQ